MRGLEALICIAILIAFATTGNPLWFIMLSIECVSIHLNDINNTLNEIKRRYK